MNNKMRPTIRLPQAIALYIGAVLGAGILIVPGLAADIAGPSSIIDWAAMLILSLPLAMCMAYLAHQYPNSGGVSHFVTLAFGEQAGSVTGWFFLMSVPIGAPVAALAGSGYISTAFGWPESVRVFIACMVLLSALYLNYVGMRLAGKIQVAVVAGIVAVLILAIIGALPHVKAANFEPFMTHGISGIGAASTILFWCFIGWEAVSHLAEEFVNPQKDVIRATLIAAVLIGLLYFLSALAVIGTDSFHSPSQAALVVIAEKSFGAPGAILVGLSSLLICLATVVAYIGAASRLARSLSIHGHAPNWLGSTSARYQTPIGGLAFLAVGFFIIMSLYVFQIFSLTQLIQLPNATFLLNYLGGCAAGVVLFKADRKKRSVSLISLIATIAMCLFLGAAILYPMAIALIIFFHKMWSHSTVS